MTPGLTTRAIRAMTIAVGGAAAVAGAGDGTMTTAAAGGTTIAVDGVTTSAGGGMIIVEVEVEVEGGTMMIGRGEIEGEGGAGVEDMRIGGTERLWARADGVLVYWQGGPGGGLKISVLKKSGLIFHITYLSC